MAMHVWFFAIGTVLLAVILIIYLFVLHHKPKRVQHSLDILEGSIRKLEQQGLEEGAIRKKLDKAGWHEHEVELVLHEMHTPHNRIDELKMFCDKQLKKGRDKEGLKEQLLNAGWSEEITDLVLGLDEERAELLREN